MSIHDYGLEWIDQDSLFEVTKNAFNRVIEKSQDVNLQAPPDPFTIAVQAILFNQTSESMLAFEKLRGINKSISNAVGVWHQAVLGLAEGWENLGSSGAVVDLFVRTQEGQNPIAIEVKNRYNTIKASDEKDMWDTLDKLARMNGTNAYLVQIVPKTPERYDRPWIVSGRPERENVRCIDGASAYTWAFNRPHALEELYVVFPKILMDVMGKDQYTPKNYIEWFYMSMPKD